MTGSLYSAFIIEAGSQRAIDHLSTFLVENSLQLTDKRESAGDKMRTPRLVGWIWLEGVLSHGVY